MRLVECFIDRLALLALILGVTKGEHEEQMSEHVVLSVVRTSSAAERTPQRDLAELQQKGGHLTSIHSDRFGAALDLCPPPAQKAGWQRSKKHPRASSIPVMAASSWRSRRGCLGSSCGGAGIR
jgi:hypothetical protein